MLAAGTAVGAANTDVLLAPPETTAELTACLASSDAKADPEMAAKSGQSETNLITAVRSDKKK